MENNSNNQEFVFTNEGIPVADRVAPVHIAERTCNGCGIILPESRLTRAHYGEYVCGDCIKKGNYIICEVCGKLVSRFDSNIFTDKQGVEHQMCASCRGLTFKKCDICGKWVPTDIAKELADGGYICDDCLKDPDEEWVECDECHKIVRADDTHSAIIFENGTEQAVQVCDRCLRNSYRTCSSCGEFVRWDNLEDSTDGRVCPNCADQYMTCDSCGILVHEDNAVWDEEAEVYYCPRCYGSNSLIRGYHNAPPRKFFGEMPFGKQGHFGYELEIDRDTMNQTEERKLTKELTSIAGDRLYFEHDGSLDYGFEIISQPHTHDAMLEDMPIKEILEACVNHGYISHKAGTCGLHFHISRQFFGNLKYRDTAIEKMMYFYDTFYDDVKRFARRTESQLHWCEKNSYEDNKYLPMKEKHLKYDVILKDYKNHDDRYRIVNTTNQDTIEIRVMRGTLLYPTFMASFDFIYNIARKSKSITWNSIDDLSQWFKGMKAETFEYMKSRNAFQQYFDGQKGE